MPDSSEKIQYDVKLLEQTLTSFTTSFASNLKKLEKSVDKLTASLKTAATKDDIKVAIEYHARFQEMEIKNLTESLHTVKAAVNKISKKIEKYVNRILQGAIGLIISGIISTIVFLLTYVFT